MDIAVFDDSAALSAAAADRIEATAAAPITLGLAGGSTPAPTYGMLGERTIEEHVLVREGRSDLSAYVQYECAELSLRGSGRGAEAS